MGFGGVILGHAVDEVSTAAISALQNGPLLGISHPTQNRLAEKIVDMVPCAEQVRFFKTGSDACSAAIRIARAFTHKEMILTSGYHGWHDTFAIDYIPGGIPASTSACCRNFAGSGGMLKKLFQEHHGNIAAVIIEPSPGMGDHGLLAAIQKACRAMGILFILDEIKTGFRVFRGGIQAACNLQPDLVLLGKALSNGFPLATVAGQRDVMACFNEVLISSTHDVEMMSLAASLKTLEIIDRDGVVTKIKIHSLGRTLMEGLARIVPGSKIDMSVIGHPAMPMLVIANPLHRNRLCWEFASRGVLVARDLFYVTPSHTDEDIAFTLQALEEALDHIDQGEKQQTLPTDVVSIILAGARKECPAIAAGWSLIDSKDEICLARNAPASGQIKLNSAACRLLERCDGTTSLECIWESMGVYDDDKQLANVSLLRKLRGYGAIVNNS